MNSRPRILVVANRFYPQVGGAEQVTFNTCRELAKHFDVDVATPLRDHNPREEVVEGIRILRLRNLHNPRNVQPYLDSPALCPGLLTLIMRGRYDLVHCFPALSRDAALALRATRLRGIPAFLTCFDAFPYADILKSGVSYEELGRLELGMRQSRHLRHFAAIFTISNRETKLLERVNPRTYLSTVPVVEEEHSQDADVAGFRRRLNLGDDEPFVLCLGRVSHIKGQDILLRALSLLDPADRPKVLIAGRADFEPEFDAGLRRFVADHGLTDRVIFTGPLSREDALAALRGCAVHVLPVRFMNSGAVVVETWASERPVLQSNRVDPNFVVEGENGFTFDVENPQELGDKLKILLRDPDLGNRMGERGKRLVESRFLYRHLIAQYLAAYAEHGGLRLELPSALPDTGN